MAKSYCFLQGSLGQEVKPLWSADRGKALPAVHRLPKQLLTDPISFT